MRVLVAQINPTVGDMEGNTKKILESIAAARAKKADIVLFSELAICGYPPEDLLLHPAFIDAQEKYLEKVVKASRGCLSWWELYGPTRRKAKNRYSTAQQ